MSVVDGCFHVLFISQWTVAGKVGYMARSPKYVEVLHSRNRVQMEERQRRRRDLGQRLKQLV
jgi:hypothetical protein